MSSFSFLVPCFGLCTAASWQPLGTVLHPPNSSDLEILKSLSSRSARCTDKQAESVSLSLQAPILVRKRAKPGCAPSVISYFSGELGKPTTLRGTLRQEALRLREEEEEEESNVVKKWESKFTGPILGPLVDKDGREIGTKEGDKSEKHDHELGGRMRERQHTEAEYEAERGAADIKDDIPVVEKKEDLRILVIGDRMMTDTLLANRLANYLSSSTSSTSSISSSSSSSSPSSNTSALPSIAASASTIPLPSVLSIHTTLLLQPKDVRPLRYIEEKLTRGRVREDSTDWGRYTKYQPPPPAPIVLSWKERINPLRDTPAPTWNPKTWKPASLVVALGLGIKTLGRGLYWVGGRVWEGEVEVAKVMAERAELAKQEAERKEAVAVVVEEVTPKK